MTELLELKEKARHFYGKYEVYLLPVVKFILALTTFLLINANIGYMTRISGLPVTFVLALLCSVLPVNGIILFAMALILANLYSLSLEVCATALALFILIGLLYFRFSPKDGYYSVLTPISFVLHIPYIMPVSVGLLRAPYSMVSVISGTVIYYFLSGVKVNETLLGTVNEDTSETSKFVITLNQLLDNKEMYLVIATFILVMILVYAIRKMPIDHAWTIATVTGILVEFIILFAGFILLGISGKMIWLVVGNIISVLIAFFQQFMFFNLDYTRTERVQFEDDEYYYYVKAVPKMYVSTGDKQVKSFGNMDKSQQRRDRISKEDLAEEMGIDKDLLDM